MKMKSLLLSFVAFLFVATLVNQLSAQNVYFDWPVNVQSYNPYSFGRAFLFAGASSVVSTLWEVDDFISSEFMRLFYNEFKTTQNTAIALQRAQHIMIGNPKFRHPYYWATYVTTGF